MRNVISRVRSARSLGLGNRGTRRDASSRLASASLRLVATVAAIAASLVALATAAPAGAVNIVVKPGSNLATGRGSYVVTVTGAKGTFASVPDPGATPVARTVTTKLGALTLTGPAGTFTAADLGMFVDDGIGGALPDGAPAIPLTPLVPVFARQGIPYVKVVNLTGTTATLSQKALATGTRSVNFIASQIPILLLTEASGSIPFIAPVLPGPGLCLTPYFPDSLCPYTPGNLAFDANKVAPVFAAANGSFSASMTLLEGTVDGGLGVVPGPIYVKIFDPDGPDGIAPTAPFAVPSTEPGATPIGCAPGLADRSIPNPAVGGVDYCMVTAIALNAGVQSTFVPFQLKQVPITWAAGGGGFVFGDAFVITGHDFANDDTLVKVIVSNLKAKQTANPLLACPALNQTILGQHADSVGAVQIVIPTYASGCTVPPTSVTRVTIIGTKDVQRSQIPPNDVIGTSLPKKSIALIPMTNPGG